MRLTFTCLRKTSSKLVDYYSQFNPSVLSIQQFLDFGEKNAASEKKSFLFLRQELPVRLANIMKEIHLLPDQLLEIPSVRLVEGWYEESFLEFALFEKAEPTCDVLKSFSETLELMRNRHKTVVETMAQGMIEMKEQSFEVDDKLDNRVQYFLDRFYMSRISIRMLTYQHLILFAKLDNHPRHIGCIDPSCDVLGVAQGAYENARFLCEQYYRTAPDCEFVCRDVNNPNFGTDHIQVTYVPSYLHQMLFELFKNSLRAVVEFHASATTLPTLRVLICKGHEDVTIMLSDEGGGICRDEIDKMFNYMYSTAPRPPSPDASNVTPLAGYGYGLPLSRLYARHFNGDLWLSSVDGYGTDAMICLKLFPGDACELLPIYNRTSSQKYTSSPQVGDWSDKSHGFTHAGTIVRAEPSKK